MTEGLVFKEFLSVVSQIDTYPFIPPSVTQTITHKMATSFGFSPEHHQAYNTLTNLMSWLDVKFLVTALEYVRTDYGVVLTSQN